MDTPPPDAFRLAAPGVPNRVREWPRLKPAGNALVSAVAESFVGRGLVLNVSRAGICCFLHSEQDDLETGQEVLLKINFHRRADTLRCVARVTWGVKAQPDRPGAHYGFEWVEGADLWAVQYLLEDPTLWEQEGP